MVKPSFQVFSLSSKATNKVPAVVLSGTWQVAGVVIGFLLHSDRSRVMEKKLTNSGPLREPEDKHSIYTTQLALHPLPPQDSHAVVASTLQRAQVPETLTQLILAKAEGNPFFLEELTRAVTERSDFQANMTVPDTI